MNFESENCEFKSAYTDEIYKEVIAFANTDGGVIYIGVDDEGNIAELESLDETYTKVTNGIRDAIVPDVTMFTKYSVNEDKIIKITVSEGSAKPYYLKAKGLKPNGVYVRQGASKCQASYEQIRSMIKECDGDIYEEMRSLIQNLTFEDAKKVFNENGIDFSAEKYTTLGITDMNSRQFTNLALLLSDQCRHTIKVAVFSDKENTLFQDSKEFGGSIFKQIEDAFAYLKLCNKNEAVIEGLRRTDKSDYPVEAVREALLNAAVHRDYSFSGSIIININNAETEFISIGGLLPGLSKEDIQNGISQPRNKRLADVFYRLHFIESYGTGIRRIFSLYKECSRQPKIEITHNTFKIVLPNMNYETGSKIKSKLSPQKQQVIDLLNNKGKITDSEIGELLNVKRTRAYVIARELCKEGLIVCVGRGVNKYYTLSKF